MGAFKNLWYSFFVRLLLNSISIECQSDMSTVYEVSFLFSLSQVFFGDSFLVRTERLRIEVVVQIVKFVT